MSKTIQRLFILNDIKLFSNDLYKIDQPSMKSVLGTVDNTFVIWTSGQSNSTWPAGNESFYEFTNTTVETSKVMIFLDGKFQNIQDT